MCRMQEKADKWSLEEHLYEKIIDRILTKEGLCLRIKPLYLSFF